MKPVLVLVAIIIAMTFIYIYRHKADLTNKEVRSEMLLNAVGNGVCTGAILGLVVAGILAPILY